MQILTANPGTESYPVYIGRNLLADKALFESHIKGNDVVIVTNETIAALFLEPLKKTLSSYQPGQVILPDGEKWKTLETASNIFDYLMSGKCDRKTTLIALGGGVVGDITGFVAACYRRGIPFIQIPTTLLAQVDSSIGGKTGVNHPLGKNMIGAFYQPQSVLADISLLDSLPEREFSAGLAEVIKYGLIADEKFYQWLEDNMEWIKKREKSTIFHAVSHSCQNKIKVVEKDEKEENVRALLNLGHTFGHAIETAQKYQGLLHGEAVAVGMMMALDLSFRLGNVPEKEIPRLRQLLEKAGLPVTMPADVKRNTFADLLYQDKKTSGNQLHFVLLEKIGSAMVKKIADTSVLNGTLDTFFNSVT